MKLSDDQLKAIEKVINDRLLNWYKNVKLDYNVDGAGECKVLPDEIFPCGTPSYKCIIVYTENGVETTSFYVFCEEWRGDNPLAGWLFDIWAEDSFKKI